MLAPVEPGRSEQPAALEAAWTHRNAADRRHPIGGDRPTCFYVLPQEVNTDLSDF